MAGDKVLVRTTGGSLAEVLLEEFLRALVEFGDLTAIGESSTPGQPVDPTSQRYADYLIEEMLSETSQDVQNRIPESLRSKLLTLLTVPTCRKRRQEITDLTRPRIAWRHRAHIFSLDGRPSLAKRFVELARSHARDPYSVPEAASALRMGVRTLARYSTAWFDLPPGLVIDLARISSVAEKIRGTEEPLKSISSTHSFQSTSTMSRLFRRFLPMSPAMYRAIFGLASLAETARTLADIDL